MTNSERLWVLGATDPEMELIWRLLNGCYETVAEALKAGERVDKRNAYQADSCTVQDPRYAEVERRVYTVECRFSQVADVVCIDHHHVGDSGFGKLPAEFLASSSIGQVITELAKLNLLGQMDWDSVSKRNYVHGSVVGQWHYFSGDDRQYPDPFNLHMSGCGWGCFTQDGYIRVPSTIVFAAAADHCLSAAYQGKCPGVNPDDLMRWRIAVRARFQGISEKELLARVEKAFEAIREASWFDGLEEYGGEIADLRGDEIPELPEAATRKGIAYLATPKPGRDGRQKIVLGGATSPEQVEWFLNHYPAVEKYGDPARGFAGGYIA